MMVGIGAIGYTLKIYLNTSVGFKIGHGILV
jgi:hypothetical protein